MMWWCQQCQVFCSPHPDKHDDPNPHWAHRQKIAGIRDDILRDEMRKVVWELTVTDRLERIR